VRRPDTSGRRIGMRSPPTGNSLDGSVVSATCRS